MSSRKPTLRDLLRLLERRMGSRLLWPQRRRRSDSRNTLSFWSATRLIVRSCASGNHNGYVASVIDDPTSHLRFVAASGRRLNQATMEQP